MKIQTLIKLYQHISISSRRKLSNTYIFDILEYATFSVHARVKATRKQNYSVMQLKLFYFLDLVSINTHVYALLMNAYET